ncbi:MAG: SDR family oxidoreductase [Dehalococcoidia bacterium]|nr:SDR family oxidoreductase [Dehalococcoidia bacterium]
MRILVAGGAGFIGSHLCDALLAAGHTVTVWDNLITGKAGNIAHLRSNESFSFSHVDIIQPLPEIEIDAIFHLASPASPVGYSRYPIETLLVNSAGTHNLLELGRVNKAKFILTSTSEAYGDPQVHPQPETYWGYVNPLGPRCMYDEGKRFAEAIVINYVWLHDLDARIVRLFNTYGPRNDPEDGRIIPNFITQALRGQPITVYGDGQQTRSFCYVSDLVRGILLAMFSDSTKGEVFNLGNPDEHTALYMANLVKELTSSISPILHAPPREEEIARRQPDITKAKTCLSWEPRVSLDEGLSLTVKWFRQRLDEGQNAST